MKFALIDAEKATCPVATACEALGVSRPGYYAWRGRPESRRASEDRRLAVKVRESFELGRTYYGSPRILKDLKADGEQVSRKRVIRLMQEQGLVARVRRRYRCTTMSDHDQAHLRWFTSGRTTGGDPAVGARLAVLRQGTMSAKKRAGFLPLERHHLSDATLPSGFRRRTPAWSRRGRSVVS